MCIHTGPHKEEKKCLSIVLNTVWVKAESDGAAETRGRCTEGRVYLLQ